MMLFLLKFFTMQNKNPYSEQICLIKLKCFIYLQSHAVLNVSAVRTCVWPAETQHIHCTTNVGWLTVRKVCVAKRNLWGRYYLHSVGQTFLPGASGVLGIWESQDPLLHWEEMATIRLYSVFTIEVLLQACWHHSSDPFFPPIHTRTHILLLNTLVLSVFISELLCWPLTSGKWAKCQESRL